MMRAAPTEAMISHGVEAGIAELRRQAETSGCTTDSNGRFVQVDGSFEMRLLVAAVLQATALKPGDDTPAES
jgi:hypothetical protein